MLWLGMAPQWAMAGTATASLDRSTTGLGESVILSVHVKGSADQDPDLSVLKKDFEILNQSQSSNYSLINGSLNRSKSWTINLMPKHVGKITIPAISLGNMHTQVLTLHVGDTPVQTGGSQGGDVFLEVTASPQNAYVQGQVLLDVKLFRAVNLAQAQLTEPDPAGAIIKKLGEDKNYESVRDQRRFVVTERSYAIFPKQSGTLHIAALQFTGQVVQSTRMFNQGGRVLRVQSKPLDIVVSPMPDTWDQAQPWLPAQELSLEEIVGDKANASLKVGEPLTRTIEIRAKGLTAEQLPQLFSSASNSAWKLYPDKPELRTEVNEDGVVGIRREKIAMIPTQAGDLALPSISVIWWDTVNHSMHKAEVLQRIISVQKSDSQQSAAPAVKQPALPIPTAKSKPVTSPLAPLQREVVGESSNTTLWQALTAFFALVWLLSLAAWYYVTVKKKKTAQQVPASTDQPSSANIKKLRKELNDACRAGNAKCVSSLLPRWAAYFFHDPSIQSLHQLSGKSEALDTALLALETALYGKVQIEEAWDGAAMLEAIAVLKMPEEVQCVQGLQSLATP